MNLFVDVDERRRDGGSVRYGEREPHGLSGFVVRVLSDDDHSHLVERTGVEGIKNKTGRREAPTGLILITHIIGEEFEIRFVKLRLQHASPRLLDTDVH